MLTKIDADFGTGLTDMFVLTFSSLYDMRIVVICKQYPEKNE